MVEPTLQLHIHKRNQMLASPRYKKDIIAEYPKLPYKVPVYSHISSHNKTRELIYLLSSTNWKLENKKLNFKLIQKSQMS